VLDVDGTLTDGSILIDEGGREIKRFNAHDGLILRVLPDLGIQTAILTGRSSGAVAERARDLRITCVRQGVVDKKQELCAVVRQLGCELAETVYIGDDLNDRSAMLLCGYRACPADAALEIREICDYVSGYGGGRGAVRDSIEWWLRQEGMYERYTAQFEAQIETKGTSL
jgi:3-deoxy-D-manno-octulosonate 8-phosphate phosphatase (KDO 8-P phosphatase)